MWYKSTEIGLNTLQGHKYYHICNLWLPPTTICTATDTIYLYS